MIRTILAIGLLGACAHPSAVPTAAALHPGPDRPGPGYAPAYPPYEGAGIAHPIYEDNPTAASQRIIFFPTRNLAIERGAFPLREGQTAVCQ